MTVHDRIEINPKIILGKPVIKGPRIHAALRYAADTLAHEEVVLEVASRSR